MKKTRFVALALLIAQAGILAAQTPPSPAELNITTEEFPLWAKDLRRAEIVTFGSLPFTIFLTTFVVDCIRWGSNGWNTSYAPWPIKDQANAVEMDLNDRFICLGVGFAGALVVALVDYIVVQVKRNNAGKQAGELGPGDPILPGPGEAVLKE
jgi:hypothetical protein